VLKSCLRFHHLKPNAEFFDVLKFISSVSCSLFSLSRHIKMLVFNWVLYNCAYNKLYLVKTVKAYSVLYVATDRCVCVEAFH